MSIEEKIPTIIKPAAIAAALIIGIICEALGIDMLYEKTTATIGNVSFSAGLLLLIIGFVLIVVALSRLSKTNRGQSPMRPWLSRIWPVLLGIVLLGIFIGTHYQFPTEDKYKILVDLILIIIGITAAVGYGIFRWFARGIEDGTRNVIKEGRNFTRAGLETSLGYSWWQFYKAERKRNTEMGVLWKKLEKVQKHLPKNEEKHKEERIANGDDYLDYLNHAIEYAECALRYASQLDEKEYEELICTCNNNLAYYLAERHTQGRAKTGDKELARNYANYIYERITKYPDRKKHWIDTYHFVMEKFSNPKY